MRQAPPPNPQANPAAALIAQAKEQDRAIVSLPPPRNPADTAAAAARKELAHRAAAAAKDLLSPAPPPPQRMGIDYRYAGQGKRRRSPLPSADIIAAQLDFRQIGNGHWRGPSLCCDGAGAGAGKRLDNPAYAIYRQPDGGARVWCYKCGDGRAAYAALRNALGMSGADWTAAPPVAAADDAPPPKGKGQAGPPPPSAAVIRRYARRAARHKQRPPPPEYRLLPAAPGWPDMKAAGVSYKKQQIGRAHV